MAQKGETPARDWLVWALTQETDECLLWPFGCNHAGYASVTTPHGRGMGAHRYVCAEAHGAPPSKDHHAAHSCHMRKCCNKRHLRWATALENCADKRRSGRYYVGERVKTAKLTDADARAIIASPEMASVLARRYGVLHSTVRKIRLGISWPHLHRKPEEAGISNAILSFGC